jgi:hypothetical protein
LHGPVLFFLLESHIRLADLLDGNDLAAAVPELERQLGDLP